MPRQTLNRLAVYSDLQTFCEDTAPGGVGIVFEHNDGDDFRAVQATLTAGTIYSVSGRSVAVIDGTDVKTLERGDGTLIATMSPAPSGTIRDVVTNGRYVLVSHGGDASLYDHDTGTRQWLASTVTSTTYDDPSATYGVALDDTYAYVTMENDGNTGYSIQALNISDGLIGWSFNNADHAHRVCVVPRGVVITGSTTSTSELVLLSKAGASLDTNTAVTGNNTWGTDCRLVTNGKHLVYTNGAQLWCFEAGDISAHVETINIGSTVINAAIDRENLYISTTSSTHLYVYAPNDNTMMTRYDFTTGETDIVASDDCALFTPTKRIHRLNTPVLMGRVDPDAAKMNPYQRLYIPDMIQGL